MQGKEAIRIEP